MGATSLFAQKFGRINTQEIIMAMPETKTMQENMDTFAKELSDNIETMNVEFNTKLQDFQKNYNTFSDAIKEVKEKELNDMQTRTREFQERAQQDYQKKQNELLAPIIDKAKSAIDKVAAAGGFLVVFDTSTGSLAYFDEATLTDVAPAVKRNWASPTRPQQRLPPNKSSYGSVRRQSIERRPVRSALSFQRPAGRKARGSVHKVEESNILNDTRLIIIIFVEI